MAGQSKAPPISYRRLSYSSDGRTYTTLADLAQNPESLAMIRAAAGHPDVVANVLSEDQAVAALARIREANTGKVKSVGRTSGTGEFTRGKILRHKPSGRKVIIIRASAGKKDGEPVHEVVDGKTGKKFMARQSNLKPVN